MTRSMTFVLAMAMAGLSLVAPARAQMSESELVMRLNRLENQVRQLTGAIEQLQYRHNQLEQQLARAPPGGVPPAARPVAPPSQPQHAPQAAAPQTYPPQPYPQPQGY